MLPNPRTARITISYRTPLTPVLGWGTSSELTGNAHHSSDKQDPGMTHVSILRTTDGAHRENRRNDTVDLFIFYVSLSSWPSLFSSLPSL
jgi:hypothetical protein